MVIVCPGCKNQITLDDLTIPAGLFKVRCTGCGRTITTQRKEESPQPSVSQSAKPSAATTDKIRPEMTSSESREVASPVEALVNDRIAAAKREILDAMQSLFRGGSIQPAIPGVELSHSKLALVCSGESSTAETLAALLKPLGYQLQSSNTAAESLKRLDTQYGLIVIDPSFTDDLDGTKKLIGRINAKKGMDRRQTFVVLLSSTQKTLDGNSAFMSGVNLIVNKADLNGLESYIRQSQKDFQQLYSAFLRVSEDRQE